MNLQISIKQLGKKRPILSNKSIEVNLIANQTYTLQMILQEIVTQQVSEFNQKREGKNLFTYFKENTVQQQAKTTGKVNFGAIYNENKVDLTKAIDTVLLAFEDGLIAVFVDDEQIEKLNIEIQVKEASIFTFVRLTFLAGSIW